MIQKVTQKKWLEILSIIFIIPVNFTGNHAIAKSANVGPFYSDTSCLTAIPERQAQDKTI